MSQLVKSKSEIRVHIRWMIRRDMPEVLAIENKSYSVPRGEEDFLRILRQRNAIGLVAEHGELVIGFVIYELYRDRVQIVDLAVDPSYRRYQIGTQLINKLMGKLSVQKRDHILIKLRETLVPGQLFLRSQKFLAVEFFREDFEDTGEDAIVMRRNLGDTP